MSRRSISPLLILVAVAFAICLPKCNFKRDAYGKLPLRFERNAGQVDSRVRFLARGSGYTLFLTSTEAVFSLNSAKAVSLKLIGSNPDAVAEGIEELPGKTNYFIGSDPSKWRANVSSYAKAKLSDVYPGVDLVYYGDGLQMEYDFVVRPGGDPKAIQFQVEGADQKFIESRGSMFVGIGGRNIHLGKPAIYQSHGGTRRPVDGDYSDHGGGRFGFNIRTYDPTIPLVIDPTVVYGTFLGGAGDDIVKGIAADSAGNAYLTGSTTSVSFPTVSPVQSGPGSKAVASYPTAFVSKISPDGSSLIYSTYLGGNGMDSGIAIALDPAGNAYILGSTTSVDFPKTAGAFQASGTFFVTKLNPAGSALTFSTYFGSGNVTAEALAVDANGGVYLGGSAGNNLITTSGSLQPVLKGGLDAFIAKLNTNGSGLVFSTFIGGTSNDDLHALALDASGNIYAVGQTFSSDFPTVDAVQGVYGGSADAFVVELSSTGASLLFSTFLGGSNVDSSESVSFDGAGNVYVTGGAGSFFPTTPGAISNSSGCFASSLSASHSLLYSTTVPKTFSCLSVADSAGRLYIGPPQPKKINSTGTAILYSVGGSFGTYASFYPMTLDGLGNLYVAFSPSSAPSGFIGPTDGAFQTVHGGGVSDAYVLKLSPTDPVPTLTSLNPSSTGVGSGSMTLAVSGTGFTPDSSIVWNGSALPTSYSTKTQLTTTIPAGYFAAASLLPVTVSNPDAGGGTSNALAFSVNNPAPAVTSLSATSVATGSSGFTLTVTGSGFLPGATVTWNGSGRATTFVSTTSLTASIIASDLGTSGTYAVGVANPAPAIAGNTLQFTVVDPHIDSASPSSVVAGGPGFTLTLTGTNFVSSAVITWNGVSRTTTFVNSTTLNVNILASDIATASPSNAIKLTNPTSTTGLGAPFFYTVNNPMPAITSLSPSSTTAGASQVLLTISGSGFVNGAVAKWNNTALSTTYLSSTSLAAFVSPNFLAPAGTNSIVVTNPVPAVGPSNTATFTVNNPSPTLTGATPSSVVAGTSGFLLTVNGDGFAPQSLASVSQGQQAATSRSTLYEGPSTLGVFLTAADLATPGSLTLGVTNPAPGGGTSGNLVFTVTSTNPAPLVGSLSPATVAAASGGFTLTVYGRNFALGSQVLWNNSARPTTFGSSQQLSASITAQDVASAGASQVTVLNPTPGGGTSNGIAFTVGASPLGSVTAVATNGYAGATVSVPLMLSLSNAGSVNAMSVGIRVLPQSSAPAITGNLGFAADAALPLDPNSPPITSSTAGTVSVLFTGFTSTITGTVKLGVVQIPIPASAVVGATYDVQITGADAAAGNNAIPLSTSDGVLTIAETYLVGDVMLHTGDSVGSFGDGAITTVDLIEILRMVAGTLTPAPATCSDRFDAMDVFPLDTTSRGGDGIINTLDLLAELRRVTNVDTSRPVRQPRTNCTSSVGGQSRRASPPGEVEATIEIEDNAIYLHARRDLDLAALVLALQVDSAPHFRNAAIGASMVDEAQPDVVTLAWLNRVKLAAGDRVLLGSVDAASHASFRSVSANEAAGREVRITTAPVR